MIKRKSLRELKELVTVMNCSSLFDLQSFCLSLLCILSAGISLLSEAAGEEQRNWWAAKAQVRMEVTVAEIPPELGRVPVEFKADLGKLLSEALLRWMNRKDQVTQGPVKNWD